MDGSLACKQVHCTGKPDIPGMINSLENTEGACIVYSALQASNVKEGRAHIQAWFFIIPSLQCYQKLTAAVPV